MNKVILIGRLTRDPELRYTTTNQAVCAFSLAVDRGYSRQKRSEMESQNRPTADFPRINVWGVQAENCSKYLNKGSLCAVEGRIQTGSYKDQNGNTVYTTDVMAERIEFLQTRSSTDNYQRNDFNQNNFNRNDFNQNDFNQDRNYNNFNQNTTSNKDSNLDQYFNDEDFAEIEDDGKVPF